MTRAELYELFRNDTYETYSHSRLNALRGCERRAFFQYIGPKNEGLDTGVGDGANFGTCIHSVSSFYYDRIQLPYLDRLDATMRYAYNLYPTIFDINRSVGNGHDGTIDKKHERFNLLMVMFDYFERYKREDELYNYLSTEMAVAMLFVPEAGDPPIFKEPFFYIMKSDGLLERKNTKEVLCKEQKSLGSAGNNAAKKRAELMLFDTQPIGYTYVMKRYLKFMGDDREMSSFMPDVVGVSHTQFDCYRDLYEVPNQRLNSWRFQAILKVERWRRFKRELQEHFDDSNYFDYAVMDTDHCNDFFSLCSFYDLCKHGPMSPALLNYKPRKRHDVFEEVSEDRRHVIE